MQCDKSLNAFTFDNNAPRNSDRIRGTRTSDASCSADNSIAARILPPDCNLQAHADDLAISLRWATKRKPMITSKQRSLIGLAALVALGSVQACSSDGSDTPTPGGGSPGAAGAHAGTPGIAGMPSLGGGGSGGAAAGAPSLGGGG